MTRLRLQLDAEQKSFEEDHGSFPGAAQEQIVSLAREYLRGHFAQPISLNDLARRFHVNQPYLARLFHKAEGVAPVRYLRDLRIGHARRLLAEHPDMEIKQVGVLCGYPDQGYFSRVFRQVTGSSPQEYRERQR
jgi:AraC-like DNA-binding protein